MSCSFSLLVGGECECDSRSKIASCGILPLVSCNKSVSGHKKLLKFSGCETEVELILARSACFQTPPNIQEMTICPLHREPFLYWLAVISYPDLSRFGNVEIRLALIDKVMQLGTREEVIKFSS